jgi:hypothetical protein
MKVLLKFANKEYDLKKKSFDRKLNSMLGIKEIFSLSRKE